MIKQQSEPRADNQVKGRQVSNFARMSAKIGSCSISMRIRLSLMAILLSQLLIHTTAIDVAGIEYLHDWTQDEGQPALSQVESQPIDTPAS